MSSIAYLKLHPSEMAVFEAASRIYSAQINNDQVDEEELMQKSILRAIKMAKLTDKLVQSDSEKE